MRTLRHLCYFPDQRAGHLQLDHLGRRPQFQLWIQPHHLFDRKSLRHRLLKRNPHSRRCRNRKRALHIHHNGRKGRLPVLQRQMRLQHHSIHGRPIHQQTQLVSKQFEQCQRNLFRSRSSVYRRCSKRSRRRGLCELEIRRGRHAVHRRRGGRAGVLQLEQWTAGRPGHVGLHSDAGGRFLQLRV